MVSPTRTIVTLLLCAPMQRITHLYDDIYGTTDAVQNTWRFVVIIVLFSLTILFTLALLGLISRMRFPKTTSFMTALYWLIVALLMLAGAGMVDLPPCYVCM